MEKEADGSIVFEKCTTNNNRGSSCSGGAQPRRVSIEESDSHQRNIRSMEGKRRRVTFADTVKNQVIAVEGLDEYTECEKRSYYMQQHDYNRIRQSIAKTVSTI